MKIFPPAVSFPVVVLLLLLSACATTGGGGDGEYAPPPETRDPLEPFNRAVYTFNQELDRFVLEPVARGYRAVVPRPVRAGVSNFFNNLWEPSIMLNNLLQGKVTHAASDLGRFVTNTTLGVFGLFDVATRLGLERHEEDLGQTLGVWGVGEGAYLVLPFFGPSNFRDGAGLYGDLQLYPPTHLSDDSTRWQVYALDTVDTRAQLLDAGDILEQAAGDDPYAFVREAYRQRRQSLIRDGGGEEPAPLDPSIFEEDEPAAAEDPSGGSR